MTAELPRCVSCRTTIVPGEDVTFRPDGRVQHATCPPLVCAVCSGEISLAGPVHPDGDAVIHASCWIRRARLTETTGDGVAGSPRSSGRGWPPTSCRG